MKLTIEPMDKFTFFNGVLCRYWRGRTDSGAECELLVSAIAVPEGQDSREYDTGLIPITLAGEAHEGYRL